MCCACAMRSTHHFGVYGLWRDDGKVVLVRKTRGPYTGLLDLPGGSPEPGETAEETLERELREEVGVVLTDVQNALSFSIHVEADAVGQAIDFTHEGWIAEVQVACPVRSDIHSEDVAGVVLAEGLAREVLSPLVSEALRLFPTFAVGTLTTERKR